MNQVQETLQKAVQTVGDTVAHNVDALQKGTILFVLSSHDKFLNGHPTGWYLPEAAHPYYAFRQAGYGVDFASPKGGKSPLDPSSVEQFKDDAECKEFLGDLTAKGGVGRNGYENTKLLNTCSEKNYLAIFYVGGHGPVFDLTDDKTSIGLIEAFYDAKKPVAAVCHAPCVLAAAKDTATGKSLVSGRKVVCFTNEEEEQAKLTDAIPFLVETRLKENGAQFQNAEPWKEYVLADRGVYTGQNPASAGPLAIKVVTALKS